MSAVARYSSPVGLDHGARSHSGRFNLRRENRITNGGIETNTTGWFVSGTNTRVRSTEQAHSGAASLKITYNDAYTPMGYHSVTITDALHAFSYWVHVPTAWDGGQIKIRHLTTGGFIGSVFTDEQYADMALRDQWQRISCVVDPDAASLSGRLDICAASAPTVGRFIYVDDAQVEPGAYPTPYIHTDGATKTRVATRHGA